MTCDAAPASALDIFALQFFGKLDAGRKQAHRNVWLDQKHFAATASTILTNSKTTSFNKKDPVWSHRGNTEKIFVEVRFRMHIVTIGIPTTGERLGDNNS